jgi:hypothetical protein
MVAKSRCYCGIIYLGTPQIAVGGPIWWGATLDRMYCATAPQHLLRDPAMRDKQRAALKEQSELFSSLVGSMRSYLFENYFFREGKRTYLSRLDGDAVSHSPKKSYVSSSRFTSPCFEVCDLLLSHSALAASPFHSVILSSR